MDLNDLVELLLDLLFGVLIVCGLVVVFLSFFITIRTLWTVL